MSLWDAIVGRKSVKLSLTDPKGWVVESSHAGKAVTPDSTLQLATAWRCVRLRYRVLGSLPMMVHERLADGSSKPAKAHWLHALIHDSPNADQTAAEFWGGMIACMDLWGNAYARIEKMGGRITALTPLRPDRMSVYRDEAGARRYRYSGPKGEERFGESEILHLRGFTVGGDVGLSAVSYGRHTLGLAMAADETASKSFSKGLQVSGFVQMLAGTKVSKDQRNDLVDLFAQFSGSPNAGKVMPLDPGMTFVPLDMKPSDAQLLESRSFNVEEICRWFDVPPILAGHAGQGQTMWGTGVEQIMLGWVTVDVNPFLKGIEQAVIKQLLSPAERLRYFAEYNREALLEADSKAKAEFLSTMTQNGLMSRNEGRAKLNLPRVAGADALTAQVNLAPLDRLGEATPETSLKHALRRVLDLDGDPS